MIDAETKAPEGPSAMVGQAGVDREGTPLGPVTLRAPRRDDAGPIGMWLGEGAAARNLALIPHPYPPGAAEALIERALAGKRSGPLWVMDRDGEAAGLVFARKDADAGAGAYRVSYVVRPASRNTGCATEGVAAAAEALFAMGAEAVTAHVFTDDSVAAKVLTRLGFVYEGDGMDWSAGRGATAPSWRYRLTRSGRG